MFWGRSLIYFYWNAMDFFQTVYLNERFKIRLGSTKKATKISVAE